MAWFRNHYHCGNCGADWEDEWSCCCDDDCRKCGSRHWTPLKSEDLTFCIEQDGEYFLIYESPRDAEDVPRYELVAIAPTETAASVFVSCRTPAYWN